MRRRWIAARIAWLVLATAVLLRALAAARWPEEAWMILGWGMTALGFPASLVTLWAIGWVSLGLAVTGLEPESGWWGTALHLAAIWLLLAAAGYLQWFRALPWLAGRWRRGAR